MNTAAHAPEKTTGMVTTRGSGLWLTHVLMIIGVLIVFFPIWLAFVASTVTQPEIVSPPMPLWPGDHFIENYKRALLSGINVPVSTVFSFSWSKAFFLDDFSNTYVTCRSANCTYL